MGALKQGWRKTIRILMESNTLIIQLIGRDPKPFMDEYFKMRKNHRTDKDCYEALEEIVYKAVGYNRYSSFESFKLQKNKRR